MLTLEAEVELLSGVWRSHLTSAFFTERFFCPAEVKGASQQVPLWEDLRALLHLSPATFFHIDPYFHYRFSGGGCAAAHLHTAVDVQLTSLALLARASCSMCECSTFTFVAVLPSPRYCPSLCGFGVSWICCGIALNQT